MEYVDVAVVGGGPAGSSAAAAAAAAGVETVVLEKGVPRQDRDEIGPDSTDAAGFLDYWVDVAGIDYQDIPDDIVLQKLRGATFVGPSEQVSFYGRTGLGNSYPSFGFTFHRARFDDWLRKRAEDTGAEYRVGTAVGTVETDVGRRHHLTLTDGQEIDANYLVLADGPGRHVTIPTLNQFMPDTRDIATSLGQQVANHIAYQEYRRIPPDVFEPSLLTFWWGWIPGHTAYPWLFPNDENIARIGLTRPLNQSIEGINEPEAYRLLREDDDRIPRGKEYIRRLLEESYPEYDLEDFPLVESRGKSDGTETYPISSTWPIDSPVDANVAVVGGAMGATSMFHEGGTHVAIRTGALAGQLAARDELVQYNDAWKAAIGDEVLRNAALAATVDGFGPAQWDRTFATINRLSNRMLGLRPGAGERFEWARAAGRTGITVGLTYAWFRRRLRAGNYVQIYESEYDCS